MNKEDTLIGSSLNHPSQWQIVVYFPFVSPKSFSRYLKSLIIQVVLGLICNEKSNFMMNHRL